MALSRTDYGSWRSPATGTWRLRQTLDASINSVTRKATIRSRVWLEPDAYSSLYDSSCHHYQTIGGTVTYDYWANRSASPGSPVLVMDQSRTFNYNAEGTLLIYGYSRISNAFIGEHWVDGYLSIDPIAPLAPSSLSVKRVTDDRTDLAWIKNAAYTGYTIRRIMNEAAATTVGAPGGSSVTWADLSTQIDSRYRYQIAGRVGTKASPYTGWTGWLYTTPAAPTGVSATRAGTDIEVSIDGFPKYATHFDIYDNDVLVASAVPRAEFPWIHSAPSAADPHTYEITASVESGGTDSVTLTSARSEPSNTVQLVAKPNPPTNLSPNGAVVEVGETDFKWLHNPVDSSPQTAYEIRYRDGTEWTTLSGTTATSHTEDLTVGLYSWQARTKGAHAEWSEWSPIATIEVIDTPVVSIVSPVDGEYLEASLTVEWSFFQTQGKPQSSWRVALLEDGEVLEQRTGTGATTSVALTSRLEDAHTYTVEVHAATGSLWATASTTIQTSFIPPSPASFVGVWSEMKGAVEISIPEIPADAVHVMVERALSEDQWQSIITSNDAISFSDYRALSNGVNVYRVTSVASTGAMTSEMHEVIADSDAIWLNGGVGYSLSARLPFNPGVALQPRRDHGSHMFDGREKPVAWVGKHRATGIPFQGSILLDDPNMASINDLETLLLNSEPVFQYRDPVVGRRYGIVSGDIARKSFNHWTFSLKLDETEPA